MWGLGPHEAEDRISIVCIAHAHAHAQVDMVNRTPSGISEGVYTESGEWHLSAIPIRRHELHYPTLGTFSDLTYWIVMQRWAGGGKGERGEGHHSDNARAVLQP